MSGAAGLVLVPETHEYYHNGVRVPGVTSLLDEFLVNFWRIPREVLERKRKIGQAVHLATALDDQGLLDTDSVAPLLWPYILAWRRFVRERRFIPLAIESLVYNRRYRYAGTLDRAGWLDDDLSGPLALVDIKVQDVLYPTVGPQTAAYLEAFVETYGERPERRVAVQLLNNGKYKVTPLLEASDYSTFLSCLQLHNFRSKHGIQAIAA